MPKFAANLPLLFTEARFWTASRAPPGPASGPSSSLADNPGRHEPGSGEINYLFLLALLDRPGYAGWIGCEYKPAGRTEDGLAWLITLTNKEYLA